METGCGSKGVETTGRDRPASISSSNLSRKSGSTVQSTFLTFHSGDYFCSLEKGFLNRSKDSLFDTLGHVEGKIKCQTPPRLDIERLVWAG